MSEAAATWRTSTPHPPSKTARPSPLLSSDAAAAAAPSFRRRRGEDRVLRHVVSHNPSDVAPMYGYGGIRGGVIVKVECCLGLRDADGCDDAEGVRSDGVGVGRDDIHEGEQADEAKKVIHSFLRSVSDREKDETKPYCCWTNSWPGKLNLGQGLPERGRTNATMAPKRARLSPDSDGGGRCNVAASANESEMEPSDKSGVIHTILRAFHVAHRHERQQSSGDAGSWRSPPAAAVSAGRGDTLEGGGVAVINCNLDNGGSCRIFVDEEGGGVAMGSRKNIPAAKDDKCLPSASPGKGTAERARTKRTLILCVEVDELGRSQLPLPCSSTCVNRGKGSPADDPKFCSSLPFSFITTIVSSTKSPPCVDKLERFLSLASRIDCSVLLPMVDDSTSAASGASVLTAAGYRRENPSRTNRSYPSVCLPRLDAAAYRDGTLPPPAPSVDGGPARVALLRDLLGYVGAASCRLEACLRAHDEDDPYRYASQYDVPFRHLAYERGGRLEVITWEGRIIPPHLVDRLVRASTRSFLDLGRGSRRCPFVAITAWWGIADRTRPGGVSRAASGATAILTPSVAPSESVLPADGKWY